MLSHIAVVAIRHNYIIDMLSPLVKRIWRATHLQFFVNEVEKCSSFVFCVKHTQLMYLNARHNLIFKRTQLQERLSHNMPCLSGSSDISFHINPPLRDCCIGDFLSFNNASSQRTGLFFFLCSLLDLINNKDFFY